MIAAIRHNLRNNNPYLAIFLSQHLNGTSVPTQDAVHQVGVLAQIYNVLAEPNESMTILVYPQTRVQIGKFTAPVNPLKSRTLGASPLHSVSRVLTSEYEALPYTVTPQFKQVSEEIIQTLNKMAELNTLVRDQINEFVRGLGLVATKDGLNYDPAKLSDFAAAMSDVPPLRLQAILEERDIMARLRMSLDVLKKELEEAELLVKTTIKQKPLHIEYVLSEKGLALVPVFRNLEQLANI